MNLTVHKQCLPWTYKQFFPMLLPRHPPFWWLLLKDTWEGLLTVALACLCLMSPMRELAHPPHVLSKCSQSHELLKGISNTTLSPILTKPSSSKERTLPYWVSHSLCLCHTVLPKGCSLFPSWGQGEDQGETGTSYLPYTNIEPNALMPLSSLGPLREKLLQRAAESIHLAPDNSQHTETHLNTTTEHFRSHYRPLLFMQSYIFKSSIGVRK